MPRTSTRIPDVSRDQLLAAIERFDVEYRGRGRWQNWEHNSRHKFAILHEDRLYPPKQIISIATGKSFNEFNGGRVAGSYVRRRGFTVIPIKSSSDSTASDQPAVSSTPSVSPTNAIAPPDEEVIRQQDEFLAWLLPYCPGPDQSRPAHLLLRLSTGTTVGVGHGAVIYSPQPPTRLICLGMIDQVVTNELRSVNISVAVTAPMYDSPITQQELADNGIDMPLDVTRPGQARLNASHWASLIHLASSRIPRSPNGDHSPILDSTAIPRRYWLAVRPQDEVEAWLVNGTLPVVDFPTSHLLPVPGDLVVTCSPSGLYGVGTVAGRAGGELQVHRWQMLSPGKITPFPQTSEYLPGWRPLSFADLQDYLIKLAAACSYVAEERIRSLVELACERKQVIFDGPPGTGKTWMARLVASIITGDDPSEGCRTRIVQFHPSYAYEDFVVGLRPGTKDQATSQFEWKLGPFLEIADFARQIRKDPVVLIIDEVNRGNLPRIFGELLFALEYRDQSVQLASGQRFRCPDNLLILGTMNTADRSIALVDYALRRRFAFIRFEPDLRVLEGWLADHPPVDLDARTLSNGLRWLNNKISEYFMQDLAVGPSYLMKAQGSSGPTRRQIRTAVITEIHPLLREYGLDYETEANEFSLDTLLLHFGVVDES